MYERRFLNLPVPAYIKDFLHCRYGSDSIVLPKNDRLNIIIRQYVRPGRPRGKHAPLAFRDHVKFEFNHIKCGPLGIWLRQNDQREINEFLIEYEFYPLFYRSVDEMVFQGMQIQDAIDKFVSDNKLNYDNIQFETLKKRYYRYRKATNNPKKKISI
jgi:hypothetical protein